MSDHKRERAWVRAWVRVRDCERVKVMERAKPLPSSIHGDGSRLAAIPGFRGLPELIVNSESIDRDGNLLGINCGEFLSPAAVFEELLDHIGSDGFRSAPANLLHHFRVWVEAEHA